MVLVGGDTSALQTIPPLQQDFFYAGQCMSECTEKAIPAEGVNVICGGLHTHLAGKKIVLRHIRDGVEQKIPFKDDHYDFNYQIFRYLPEEIKVLPGDQLMTDCHYNTVDKTEPTFGGEATHEEMCLTFVRYYPRTPLGWSDCTSDPSYRNYFSALGIQSVYLPIRKQKLFSPRGESRAWIEEIVVKRPESLQNMTVGEVIRSIDWSDEKISQDFSDALAYGEHDCYCYGTGQQLMNSVENFYPHFEQYFEPEEDCTRVATESPGGATANVMFPLFVIFSVLLTAM